MKRTLALLLTLLFVFVAVSCSGNTETNTPNNSGNENNSSNENESPADNENNDDGATGEVTADVPADRYDATETPRSGNNESNPFVISTGTLDGKFNPFFATSAYDRDVSDMTQLNLLDSDKDGAPVAGVDARSFAYDYTQEPSDDESTTTYKFTLKNGITFSDGEPITAKDALFSLYVYSDPMYDGASTLYSVDIQGLDEYRLQTSSETIEKTEAIMEAGIEDEDGSIVMNPAEGVTEEEQETFWGYLDAAGEEFAQEIIDLVNDQYPSYIEEAFAAYTPEEVAEDESLQAAFGMVMWGFGELDEDGGFTDAMGNEYDLANDTVDAKVFWENIFDAYGYDISDDGINAEMADEKTIEEYVQEAYIAGEAEVEGGVDSISGITSDTEKSDDGVEREYIEIIIDGVDPTAIFKLGGVEIVPFHYYTDGYDGELNSNGVDTGKKEFMDHLKTKNDKPVGAGPYVFEEYKDNVVTYTANDDFLLGSPKIKTLRYQEISLGAELDATLTDTVHFSDPSASPDIINDITGGSGDYEKLDYTLVDNDGYGYIGIQAQAIPEFEVRKALAHAMNIELAIDDYYGELASANYRTMTKVIWAYPDNPEDLFPYDETGETSKGLFEEAGYKFDEGKNEMLYPDDHEKAGTQVTFKFTLPSEAKDHPAGSILLDTQKVLESIGVKIDFETDENLLGKLNTAYDSGIEVWAAAWGEGGVDPDMFQIWYSDPKENQGTSSTGLFYMFENGSDEEKEMLTDLNNLIKAGRSTLDEEERKAIYKEALELSTGLAVEIPTYQRKNMYVFNADVVNSDTLLSGEDVTPFQSPLKLIWDVELN